jgi:hypothetical protein
MYGARSLARVSSGHTGPRRGSPVMVAPACSGVRNPLNRTDPSKPGPDESGCCRYSIRKTRWNAPTSVGAFSLYALSDSASWGL